MRWVVYSFGGRFGLRPISFVVAALCCVSPWGAVADLPIHATIKDIKGSWTFFLTPPVFGAISTCGSGAPNRNTENLQPNISDSQAYLKSHGGVASTLQLQLSDSTVAFSNVRDASENPHRGAWRALAVRDAKSNAVVGSWTAVYDEGFEVRLRDNNTKLMAFMKYTKDDSCPAAKDGDLEDRNGRTVCYSTDANKTQLGWYTTTAQDGTVSSGCFYAEKSRDAAEALAPPSFVYVRERNQEAGDKSLRFSGNGPTYYLSKEFVDKHNEKLASSWKASYETSFIQQHRTVLSSLIKDFGFSKVNSVDGRESMPSFLQGEIGSNENASSQLYACPCKAGETVQDTRAEDHSTTTVLSPISMLQSNTTVADVREHQHESLADTSATAPQVQSDGLPKEFAWPNPFTDPSFLEHSTNQGGCGSCYAIAAVYALEKRFDIQASKLLGEKVSVFGGKQPPSFLEKPLDRLSPQHILSCSFYNQGCHGGFPYLVGKHAAEMGVLGEGCMPYSADDNSGCPALTSVQSVGTASQQSLSALQAATGNSTQAESCHAGDRRWFAKDYGYVGGCYECGECSGEQKIMAELYANGPVTAAFDAPASLFSYTGGVYDTDDAPHARVCDNPGAAGTPSGLNGWEFTNHAVNIVGWGETETTPSQKYWIVRNTWGPDWGKHGYFLLARGKNVGGIESQVSYVDPDFSRGMGRSLLEMILSSKAPGQSEDQAA